jgi:UDP-N-acetylglucosamine 2-epimerase
MYDALLSHINGATEHSSILSTLNLHPKEYFLATLHRAENTDDSQKLSAALAAFNTLSAVHPVIWPIHPRTRQRLKAGSVDCSSNNRALLVIDPLPYLDMLILEKEAKLILTDSGGVQKEAFWLGVRCLTLRDESEWTETVETGWNTLVGTDLDRIVKAALRQEPLPPRPDGLYGDGNSARRIVGELLRMPRSV